MNPNDTVTLRELTDFTKLLLEASKDRLNVSDTEGDAIKAIRLNCEGLGILVAADLLIAHFKLLEPAT